MFYSFVQNFQLLGFGGGKNIGEGYNTFRIWITHLPMQISGKSVLVSKFT